MFTMNVIEQVKMKLASRIVLVPKKNGTLRFFVIYRKLKNVTLRDSYTTPRVDERIDSLRYATIFSTLKLAADLGK